MNTLKELFDKANIKYIISVDDCYYSMSDTEEIRHNMNLQFQKNKEEFCEFLDLIGRKDWGELAREIDEGYSEFVEGIINNFTDTNLEIFYERYQSKSIETLALEKFCNDLKNNDIIIDFVKFTSISAAEQYKSKVETELELSENDRILWMVDKDFSRSGGTTEDGFKLISKLICDQGRKRNDIYALTSSLAAEQTSDELRRALHSEFEKTEELLLACVIQKGCIIDCKYEELYDQIASGIRDNYSHIITGELTENLRQGSDAAGNQLRDLGQDVIYKVFFKSSIMEGISPIETFQRLLMIVLKTDIEKRIAEKYDDISKLLYNYAEICKWCTVNKKQESDYKKVNKFRKDECYNYFINNTFSPVSYGDVFEINGKSYILIAQSCDLMLRDNGSRNYKCATLAEIEKVNEEKQTSKQYMLRYFNEESLYSINFNSTINIDFNVLDLCALNNNGELNYKSMFALDEVAYRYAVGTRVHLESVVTYCKNLCLKYKLLKEDFASMKFEDFLIKMKDIHSDNSTELTATYEDGVRYNGKRICRIATEIMNDIALKYAGHHSRLGLNYDFAQKIKLITYRIIFSLPFERLGLSEEVFEASLKEKIFTFFQGPEIEDKQIKKLVIPEFEQYYNNLFFKGMIELKSGFAKIDNLNNIVVSKYFPCILLRKNRPELLEIRNEKIFFKFDKNDVPGVKSFSNKSYDSGNNAMKVSNGVITFEFSGGFPFEFENEEILENKVKILLEIKNGICVQII